MFPVILGSVEHEVTFYSMSGNGAGSFLSPPLDDLPATMAFVAGRDSSVEDTIHKLVGIKVLFEKSSGVEAKTTTYQLLAQKKKSFHPINF
ncbi:hypothetical protein CPAR01_09512 [Colletotrichum paranaense]|uniref:Uncharacterized protein n=1 Tax=Colletotrichum paranaense TaxID=1914294 RepID=A0ABQ9SGY9_9PEZI|nr:uncharacterized protein CPAR01_09512 [Colletotrichum paranaense]KAK1535970.1 hypothetical protein CPAR01_09512 [Colletotrichum paranaense]